MKTITLTDEQAQALTLFLLTTTRYRREEIEACKKLSQEKKEDGTPKFPQMAQNATFLEQQHAIIEEIIQVLDAAPYINNENDLRKGEKISQDMGIYKPHESGIGYVLVEDIAEKQFDIPLPIPISAEDIENIVITSIEGGSTHWLGVDNTTDDWANKPQGMPVSQYVMQLLLEGKTVHLFGIEEDDEKWELTMDKLLRGIGVAVTEGRSIDDCEEWVADIIMQYAVFDALVYA